jgi:hypothetical protein
MSPPSVASCSVTFTTPSANAAGAPNSPHATDATASAAITFFLKSNLLFSVVATMAKLHRTQYFRHIKDW